MKHKKMWIDEVKAKHWCKNHFIRGNHLQDDLLNNLSEYQKYERRKERGDRE